MKHKFKSGQRVRATQILFGPPQRITIEEGQEFEIDQVKPYYYDTNHIGVTLKGLDGFFHQRYFELVEEMKIEEFKIGDKVFMTNGKSTKEGIVLDTDFIKWYAAGKFKKTTAVKTRYIDDKDSSRNYDEIFYFLKTNNTCATANLTSDWYITKEPPFDWAALWAAVPSWHDEIVCQPSGEWTSRKDVNGIFDFIHIPKELAPPFVKDLSDIYKRPSL